jgi:hypothetical protein
VAIDDWNWRLSVELQDVPWDCAAASLTWCLNTIGRNVTEAQFVAGLGPGRISATYGLLDASGAGLVSYLAELGIAASNDANSSWQELIEGAGHQPMLAGGRSWCHWTGIRMSGLTFGRPDVPALALANPAPGWMGIDQVLTEPDVQLLGPFSAVWMNSW